METGFFSLGCVRSPCKTRKGRNCNVGGWQGTLSQSLQCALLNLNLEDFEQYFGVTVLLDNGQTPWEDCSWVEPLHHSRRAAAIEVWAQTEVFVVKGVSCILNTYVVAHVLNIGFGSMLLLSVKCTIIYDCAIIFLIYCWWTHKLTKKSTWQRNLAINWSCLE